MPHRGILFSHSILLVCQLAGLLEEADTSDVLSAVDLGQRYLPHALKGDGEQVDPSAEV